MALRAVVFVGPTLVPGDRPDWAGIVYHPPAIRGDIEKAARDGVWIIGLIDGEFSQSLAVTPSEIRRVAREGVTILGASSMGAIRAVESPNHMIGVGQIVEMFRQGVLTGDDEVAGTYHPTTFATVGVPLVNIRYALGRAVDQSLLAVQQADAIVTDLAKLPYYERTGDEIERIACRFLEEACVPKLVDFLFERENNLKRRDALSLVGQVAARLRQETAGKETEGLGHGTEPGC
jgi:ribosomal protein S12 methylthiotransferase accessory factor